MGAKIHRFYQIAKSGHVYGIADIVSLYGVDGCAVCRY